MQQYFASQRDNIFRNVEVLIYVFDVESRELERDVHYYQSCLEALLQVGTILEYEIRRVRRVDFIKFLLYFTIRTPPMPRFSV